MALTFNPVDKIKNFLDRDEYVDADMQAILNDPDALAVNSMTEDQLVDALADIQSNVEAKIALVTTMVGRDESSRCVSASSSKRRSLPRAGQSWPIGRSKVLRNYAHAVASLIFCVTAIAGVFLYQKYSQAEAALAEADQRGLTKLADAVEKLSSQGQLLSEINAKLALIETKTATVNQAVFSSSPSEAALAKADQRGLTKLADTAKQLSSQEELMKLISAKIRPVDLEPATVNQAVFVLPPSEAALDEADQRGLRTIDYAVEKLYSKKGEILNAMNERLRSFDVKMANAAKANRIYELALGSINNDGILLGTPELHRTIFGPMNRYFSAFGYSFGGIFPLELNPSYRSGSVVTDNLIYGLFGGAALRRPTLANLDISDVREPF